MKHLLLVSFVLFAFTPSGSQTYKPVDANSSIQFSIKNFGSAVKGSFKGLQGKIGFDPDKPEKSSFEVSVDAGTINTDNKTRDNHLRKEEYFDVAKSPRISFVSTKISKGTKAGSYVVNGKLTIKQTTKPVTIPFTASAKDGGYLFTGSFELNRRDYKVGKNSPIMGDTVELELIVFASK